MNESESCSVVGCHSLLQEIFPTQGWNPGLLHCRQILYQLSHQGSPHVPRNMLQPSVSALLRMLPSTVTGILVRTFSSRGVFVWLWCQQASLNELGSVPTSSIFLKSLRRIESSSFNIQNSPVKWSNSEFSFVGRYFITDLISLLVTGIFRFSISL